MINIRVYFNPTTSRYSVREVDTSQLRFVGYSIDEIGQWVRSRGGALGAIRRDDDGHRFRAGRMPLAIPLDCLTVVSTSTALWAN